MAEHLRCAAYHVGGIMIRAAGRGAAAVAAILALAACGSSGSGSGQAYTERFSDAPALLTQCVIERDSLPGAFEEGSAQWLDRSTGEISITKGNSASFLSWFTSHDSGVVAGKSLASWRKWSAQSDSLPTAVCGSNPDPAQMQKQVFAQDSGAGNPW